MKDRRRLIGRIGHIALDLFYYSCIVLFAIVLLRVFVFSSYKIPTDSMEPAILPGDYVLVNKPAYGARLFDLFDAFDGKRVKMVRVPGYSRVKRNDVIVFHIPHPRSWDRIEMDMLKYYIKRCIALPGDTLRIVNGVYEVNSDTLLRLGNYAGELALRGKSEEMLPRGVYRTFPWDSLLSWNIKEFGPLFIPRKGDEIPLNRSNALLYRKIIEWEKQRPLALENDTLRDGNTPLLSYRFTHDYYFMGGDRVEDSQDSRYWGLLPDELIVGRAWLVWRSKEPHSGKTRYDRILKKIR